MITVTVGVSTVQIAPGSLGIRNAIEERSTGGFTVVDRLGTASYVKGQTIGISQNGTVLFAGLVDSVERYRLPNSTILYHRLSCVDWHYLADKRRAAESYVSTPAGTIVTDLLNTYLVPEGITAGTIQAGPTIEAMVINYAPISDAIAKLAELAGFIWYIDESKALHFMARETVPAPFILETWNIKRLSPLTKQSAPQYRNRQYLRAGRDVTAPQTATYTGAVGQKDFVVGYPISEKPVVTVAGVPVAAALVGIKGIDTAMTVYWSKGDPIITFAVAPGAVSVVIDYIGEYDILVMAEDAAAIAERQTIEGGTGIIEAMDDEPSLTSKQAAFDSALAKLAKYGIIGTMLEFETFEAGLEPGQLLTINYPQLGYSMTETLIESVEISEFAPNLLLYSVKAITGPEQGDWSRLFARLGQQADRVLDRLNVGKDQLLIILNQQQGNWEWTETVTETVFACTACNGTPCGDGVIVC